MYTSHGYQVPGTANGEFVPPVFESCGGIGNCQQCTREAELKTLENPQQMQRLFDEWWVAQGYPVTTPANQMNTDEIEPHPDFVPISAPVADTAKDEE